MLWALVGAETDLETLDVTLNYIRLVPGGLLTKTNTTLTMQDTVTTAEGLAANTEYVLTHTIDQGAGDNNGFSNGDNTVGLAFEMKMTNITGVIAMNVIAIRLIYEVLY